MNQITLENKLYQIQSIPEGRSRFIFLFFSLSWRDSPPVGLGLLLIHEDFCGFPDHTQRHTTVHKYTINILKWKYSEENNILECVEKLRPRTPK